MCFLVFFVLPELPQHIFKEDMIVEEEEPSNYNSTRSTKEPETPNLEEQQEEMSSLELRNLKTSNYVLLRCYIRVKIKVWTIIVRNLV